MSYWGRGRRIEVEVDDNLTPTAFVWQNQHHAVVKIERRWRVKRGWWVMLEWREYFRLTTNTGRLVIIFYDFVAKEWFLQRVYD